MWQLNFFSFPMGIILNVVAARQSMVINNLGNLNYQSHFSQPVFFHSFYLHIIRCDESNAHIINSLNKKINVQIKNAETAAAYFQTTARLIHGLGFLVVRTLLRDRL